MINKAVSLLLLASFATIFSGAVFEEFGDLLYGIGALGTMVFGIISIVRLNAVNEKSSLPYVVGFVMMMFWISAFFVDRLLGFFAPLYTIFLVITSIILFLNGDRKFNAGI